MAKNDLLVPLKSLAGKRNLLIGVAVQASHLRNNSDYRELIKQEFNLITPENEMKWERLSKGKGIYDFNDADYIINFAQENNLKVHGHVLVWNKQLPEWLIKGNFSPTELREILQQHIRAVLHHFKGKVIAWDVVNEALEDKEEGKFDKNNFWYKNLGPEYIDLVFSYAHETDPQAELFYNEWGAEGLEKKSEEMYKLISGLVNKKVPITGVGLQMHIGLGFSPSPKDVVENIQRYTKLGLKVYITEMDVRIQYGKGTLEKKLEEQAKIYRDLIEMIIDRTKIEALIFWGLDDQHSWITWSVNKNDAPLLFDRNLKPKQAYYAVTEALK